MGMFMIDCQCEDCFLVILVIYIKSSCKGQHVTASACLFLCMYTKVIAVLQDYYIFLGGGGGLEPSPISLRPLLAECISPK
jgi:hypothetical protein